MKRLAIAAALALGGCVSTTDVLQIGPNDYMVSSSADGMRWSTAAQERAVKAAITYCQQRDALPDVKRNDVAPVRMGIDTMVTVYFSCLGRAS